MTTRVPSSIRRHLATVFNDPKFEDRRFDGYDPYVRYLAINTKQGPEL